MAQASVALKLARTFLNDINGITWSEAVLMPYLQLAHREMVLELEKHNSGILKYQTNPITIPAGALDMGVNQPTNIINPISMVEGDPGSDIEFYTDMVKVTFLPFVDQSRDLCYWAWINQKVVFVGATAIKSVILRYEGTIPIPQVQTDEIGVIFGENYLGPRIASLAAVSAGKDDSMFASIAGQNLYSIIQNAVVNDQRPTRRRAYRSSKGAYTPGRL